mmetsp:Transcript_37399/g.101270  ORF Transcript_37399/g.101270 Transcript_37399/m.101270 type:complete len:532 (+) Transcript_37399:12843-14438(+)
MVVDDDVALRSVDRDRGVFDVVQREHVSSEVGAMHVDHGAANRRARLGPSWDAVTRQIDPSDVGRRVGHVNVRARPDLVANCRLPAELVADPWHRGALHGHVGLGDVAADGVVVPPLGLGNVLGHVLGVGRREGVRVLHRDRVHVLAVPFRSRHRSKVLSAESDQLTTARPHAEEAALAVVRIDCRRLIRSGHVRSGPLLRPDGHAPPVVLADPDARRALHLGVAHGHVALGGAVQLAREVGKLGVLVHGRDFVGLVHLAEVLAGDGHDQRAVGQEAAARRVVERGHVRQRVVRRGVRERRGLVAKRHVPTLVEADTRRTGADDDSVRNVDGAVDGVEHAAPQLRQVIVLVDRGDHVRLRHGAKVVAHQCHVLATVRDQATVRRDRLGDGGPLVRGGVRRERRVLPADHQLPAMVVADALVGSAAGGLVRLDHFARHGDERIAAQVLQLRVVVVAEEEVVVRLERRSELSTVDDDGLVARRAQEARDRGNRGDRGRVVRGQVVLPVRRVLRANPRSPLEVEPDALRDGADH